MKPLKTVETKSAIFSGVRMAGSSGPFEIRPHMDHLKSDLQKVQISNVSGIQMVGFQIPTLNYCLKISNLVGLYL